MQRDWKDDNAWEQQWWGLCTNTYGEEQKQLVYAKRMGLRTFHDGKSPYNIDLQGRSILDVGGGPCSLLLKCVNGGHKTVVDPCVYPEWVYLRYEVAGIDWIQEQAETLNVQPYDEAWIYNVLQHVEDPAKVVVAVKRAAKIIRLFEWIETDITFGHPYAFTAETLDMLLGGEGKVEQLNGEATCVGKCYYGVFKGDHYAAL